MGSPRVFRYVGTVFTVLLMAATVGVMPAPASAQVGEHQLVQAPDGSLYVFENGELHAIQPVPLTVPQIVGLPLGAPVTDGVAIIWSGGPAVAETPVENAGPANPAIGMVGQRAEYC